MKLRCLLRFVVGASVLFVISALGTLSMAQGGDVVSVAGFETPRLEKGAPEGWELQESKGTPNVQMDKVGESYTLHLKSDSESSFGIKKELDLDPEDYPRISWRWKALRLPEGGDVRQKATDDQALQVYVAFKATGWPKKLNTPLLGYIWDNEAPKGTMVKSSQPLADKVRYIVLRNGEDALGEWYSESRNILEDYKKLYPDIDEGNPRPITGISFYINSQNTKSGAESFIYDLSFGRDEK